jgi:hypothetical protein
MDADEALSAPMARVLEEWTDFDVAGFALGRHLGVFPAGGGEEFRKVKGVFWSDNELGDALYDALGAMVALGNLEFLEHSLVSYPMYRWPQGVAPAGLPTDLSGSVEPELAAEHLVRLWREKRAQGLRTSGGVELTEQMFAALAEEAEAGYDLDRVHPRGSRPISGKKLRGDVD